MTSRIRTSRKAPISPTLLSDTPLCREVQEEFVAPIGPGTPDGEPDADEPQEPDNEEQLDEAGSEAQQLKTHRDHYCPTIEEIEEHRRTHLPYRAWCKFCVMGRGVGAPHAAVDHVSAIPIVSLDYFFITDGDMKRRAELEEYPCDPEGDTKLEEDRQRGKVMKCLVMKCRDSKTVFAHAVPCKGRDEDGYVVQLITENVKWLGHVKLILKSDGENAIKAIVEDALKAIRVQVVDMEQVTSERPPPYDSKSNGFIENAVKGVRGHFRTLRLDLESRLERKIPVNHALMHWMIELSALLQTAMNVGEDGLTAWTRIRGRPFAMRGYTFGEKILWKMPSKGPHAMPDGNAGAKWGEGVFMGYSRSSNTYRVATDQGMRYPRSLERVPEAERWSRDTLAGIKCTPESTKVMPNDEEVFEHQAPAVEMPARDHDVLPRRFKVTNLDIEKFGYTARCAQCEYTREHRRARPGLSHDERCRARIMAELGKSLSGQQRLQAYEDRVNEALAKRIEESDRRGEDVQPQGPREGELGDEGQRDISRAPRQVLGGDAAQPLEDPRWSGPAPFDEEHGPASRAQAHHEEPAGPIHPGDEDDMAVGSIRAEDLHRGLRERRRELFVFATDIQRCRACGWVGQPSVKQRCKNPWCRGINMLYPDDQGSREGWFPPADEPAVAKPQGFVATAGGDHNDDIGADAEICLLMMEQMGGYKRSYRRERAAAFRRVVTEVYSPPRLTSMIGDMRKQGLGPGLSLDITCTDPDDGQPWDLSVPAKQEKALRMIREQRPLFLVGSPCCREFSTWQALNAAKHNRDEAKIAAARESNRWW